MYMSFEAFARIRSWPPVRLGALAGMVVAAVAGLLLAKHRAGRRRGPTSRRLWHKHPSRHGARRHRQDQAGEKSGAKDLTSAEVKAAWPRAKMLEAIRATA